MDCRGNKLPRNDENLGLFKNCRKIVENLRKYLGKLCKVSIGKISLWKKPTFPNFFPYNFQQLKTPKFNQLVINFSTFYTGPIITINYYRKDIET
jgi:hypothetical protein